MFHYDIFLFFPGRSGSCLLLAPNKNGRTSITGCQLPDHFLLDPSSCSWIFWARSPNAVDLFESQTSVVCKSSEYLSSGLVFIQMSNIQILLCQQFCDAYRLIKRNPFKTPKVWETLFTSWTKGVLSKGLWNTVWTKIFYFNTCRQLDVKLTKLLYAHCRQTDILGSSACLALSVITLVAPSSFY